VRRVANLPRKAERRFARLDAATIAAHVDLDIDRERDPSLARRRVERADLTHIVGAHPDTGVMGKRHQPPQFLAADDLIRDEHVPDPTLDHRLGLADLLAAHADRTQIHLFQRNGRAFVGLGMRPRSHRAPGDALRQTTQVALERVKVNHERWGVHLIERHSDFGGGTDGHSLAS